MTTISESTTLGVDLNPASYSSPVVIEAGVTISNPAYPYAVYRHPGATTFFVIQNSGAITSGTGAGVYLAPGGAVTNATSASIVGKTDGIKIAGGAGTVVNYGSIAATGTSAFNNIGVYLKAGGSITNAASAAISGSTLNGVGIYVIGGAGTVLNDGSIGGAVNGFGIDFHEGGAVTNAAAATIGNGLRITGAAGTVVNDGSIGAEVYLAAGGSVTNGVSATISGAGVEGVNIAGGAGTVSNDGTIGGEIYLYGAAGNVVNHGLIAGFVALQSGGSITNGVSASITDGITVAGGIMGTGAGTLTNDGSIGGGITFNRGGSVTNAVGAEIAGNVQLSFNVGTVVNSGGIAGEVYLFAGGSTTNAATGKIISGNTGVDINGPKETLLNAGSITGGVSGNGVFLGSGDDVTNAASASITGGQYGVDIPHGGTLTNAGIIAGNSGTAVAFGGAGSNLLVLDPGFSFSGLVEGGTTASNTLELASATSVGTISGLGSKYIHFDTIDLDAGAQWSITGLQRGLAGPISGFTAGDTIVMTGVTATGSSFVAGILTLDVSGGAPATLDLPGPFALANFDVTPGVAGGTEVTFVPCFRAGTRILTASGEVPVEQLRIGDRVVTLLGQRLAPIVWLGHRHVDCLRHPRPHEVHPILVKAGAIADGAPHRDLWLSPDHAILLRTEQAAVLVPIRHLLNGTSIAQVPVPSVTYWHVELASHDAMVAEGLPAETYLDSGNRSGFANGGAAVADRARLANAAPGIHIRV